MSMWLGWWTDGRRVAATVATWRAASGSMLADPETAARAARALDQTIRQAVLADDGGREAFEWPAAHKWTVIDMAADWATIHPDA